LLIEERGFPMHESANEIGNSIVCSIPLKIFTLLLVLPFFRNLSSDPTPIPGINSYACHQVIPLEVVAWVPTYNPLSIALAVIAVVGRISISSTLINVWLH